MGLSRQRKWCSKLW